MCSLTFVVLYYRIERNAEADAELAGFHRDFAALTVSLGMHVLCVCLMCMPYVYALCVYLVCPLVYVACVDTLMYALYVWPYMCGVRGVPPRLCRAHCAARYVCLICMPYVYALCVCLICMARMHVCLICMP